MSRTPVPARSPAASSQASAPAPVPVVTGGERAEAGEPEERVVLAIGGMTCAACARRVEKALRKAPGVDDAVVNLATHRATVVYAPGHTGIAALEAAVADAGYRASPAAAHGGDDDAARALGRRVAVAVAAGAPVVALGMSHGLVHVPGAAWIELVLSVPVLAWAGAPIYRAAWGAVRHRATDMNVLVALGTLAAFVYSLAATVWPRGLARGHHGAPPVYFEAAVAVIALVLLGRWLEARARRRAGESLGRLRALVPPTAAVLVDGVETRRAVERIAAGDVVVVRPGQTIPIDGEVIEGASSVAEAVMTGEAIPRDRGPGDTVLAGTTNSWGRLVVRASRDATSTALAQIVDAVEAAMGSRAPIARLADRVAAIFTPVVLVIAAITVAGWLALGPGDDVAARLPAALLAATSVLVVACPCALGLATPTALVAGLGRAAELGVLFKSAAALERLGSVDTVVLDKTGTLTEGRPDLVAVDVVGGRSDAELLALVASAEEASEHPLAGAFLRAAGARGIAVRHADTFMSSPGRGIVATVAGHEVAVGSPTFLRERGVAIDPARLDALTSGGATPVAAAVDGTLAALYALGDRARPGSRAAVAALHAAGLETVMITGDSRAAAERVAADLGITRTVSETMPQDKAARVQQLRRDGRRVAMVGDGVNDAPALAAADVGVAMGSAADVAAVGADIVLLRDDVSGLSGSVALARRTLRIIRENLFWAFSYNVLALPIAAGALYPSTGWLLSPMLASAAMSLSSLSVVLNSLRLRRFRTGHPAGMPRIAV